MLNSRSPVPFLTRRGGSWFLQRESARFVHRGLEYASGRLDYQGVRFARRTP